MSLITPIFLSTTRRFHQQTSGGRYRIITKGDGVFDARDAWDPRGGQAWDPRGGTWDPRGGTWDPRGGGQGTSLDPRGGFILPAVKTLFGLGVKDVGMEIGQALLPGLVDSAKDLGGFAISSITDKFKRKLNPTTQIAPPLVAAEPLLKYIKSESIYDSI